MLNAACITPNAKAAAAPALAANEANLLEWEALMATVFSYFKIALLHTKKAVDYLQHRVVNYQAHEVGYNSGGLHVESKNHHLISSMVKYGLLKPLPAKGYSVWTKDCIIFSLKNQEGKIMSLYGTNGLMQEHQQAILSCSGLQEIIFMLDDDETGRAAVTYTERFDFIRWLQDKGKGKGVIKASYACCGITLRIWWVKGCEWITLQQVFLSEGCPAGYLVTC